MKIIDAQTQSQLVEQLKAYIVKELPHRIQQCQTKWNIYYQQAHMNKLELKSWILDNPFQLLWEEQKYWGSSEKIHTLRIAIVKCRYQKHNYTPVFDTRYSHEKWLLNLLRPRETARLIHEWIQEVKTNDVF